MLEVQEQQHRRIVVLSSAALVFAAFACWELFRGVLGEADTLNAWRAQVYLLSCIVLMGSAITVTMVQSFLDYNELRRKHLVDSLTGLASRAAFEDGLSGRLARLAAGQGLILVYADIRRFKSLNQSFGHEAADAIIKAVGERLAQLNLEGAVLARLNGGLFAICLREAGNGGAGDIADAIELALVPPVEVAGKNVYVDLSLGSAHFTRTDRVDAVEAMRRAEFALAESKAAGGKHVSYSDRSNQTARRKSTIETGLRETLETDEIDIYFQPIVDSNFDRIVAVEALARWTHPQYGRVPPLDFIGMAESLGLVCKMGMNILRRACTQIGPLEGVRLAVNISPRQFLAPGFVNDVKAVLTETGFPASRLELEITESILLAKNAEGREAVAGVRALGVSVALDDFGTGYSGLSYLNTFAVDRIKIDRSFMTGIENSPGAQSIVSNTVRIAREHNIAITVEGIETMDQVLYLKDFGYVWLQGYLFARPMPFDQLVRSAQFASAAPEAEDPEQGESAIRLSA